MAAEAASDLITAQANAYILLQSPTEGLFPSYILSSLGLLPASYISPSYLLFLYPVFACTQSPIHPMKCWSLSAYNFGSLFTCHPWPVLTQCLGSSASHRVSLKSSSSLQMASSCATHLHFQVHLVTQEHPNVI